MAALSAGMAKESHVITPLSLWKGHRYDYTVERKNGDPDPEPAPLLCLCFSVGENRLFSHGNFGSS